MDPSSLDKLLGDYRNVPLPPAPRNLSAKVWREIRVRQSARLSTVLDYNEFLVWFRQRFSLLVAPALAMTLLVSIGGTAAIYQSTSSTAPQQPLGLQVFSHQSSALTRWVP